MVRIKCSFFFWPHGSKRKDTAESRATRIDVSDISKPFNLQTSNPIGYPYVWNPVRVQEPPRVRHHHKRRCDMSIMCVGDESRHSPLSPRRRSQMPPIPHPPLPPTPPSPHHPVPAPYLPSGKKLRDAKKCSRPGFAPPSQLSEWVPPAGASLRTDAMCYACERLPQRGAYGLCVNCARPPSRPPHPLLSSRMLTEGVQAPQY